MSIGGYKKKTRPALWTQTPSALAEFEVLHDRRAAAKAEKLRVRSIRKLEKRIERGQRQFERIQKQLARERVAAAVDRAALPQPSASSKRKRVRSVSKRRQVQSRDYPAAARAFVAKAIADGKTGPVYPGEPLSDNHHIYGRRGRLLMWKPGWLAVSRRGHRRIEEFPRYARSQGWLGPVGTYNDFERAVEHARSKP